MEKQWKPSDIREFLNNGSMISAGMPWTIILSFFAIGIAAGLLSARVARQRSTKQ